jgi:hypothetical protein
MPSETAIQLIRVSFPSISEAQARAIIGPMDGFIQDKPEPEPNPFGKPAAVPPVDKPEEDDDEGGNG